jgi:hypothetical protein
LLGAIRSDLKRARTLKKQLEAVTQAMRQRDGQRIDDGFNLIPKAHFVVANMRMEGQEGAEDVPATDLASNYREEVLNIRNPSQFFENFMLKHNSLGFRAYIAMMMQLLGDDIKSANPSRGIGQLHATREGLFQAEICNQIFENVITIDHKLEHILLLRLRETGIYEERRMTIEYTPDCLHVSISYGETPPEVAHRIPTSERTDHFSQLTELVRSEHVDQFIIPNSRDGDARTFRFAIQRRYGLPVERDLPDGWPLPSQIAANKKTENEDADT